MGGCCSVDAVESESNKIFKVRNKSKGHVPRTGLDDANHEPL